MMIRSLLDLNLRYSLQTKGRAPTQLELLDLVTAKLDDQTILLLGRWRQSPEILLVYLIPSTFQSSHGNQTGLLQQSQDEHCCGTSGNFSLFF